MKTNLRIQLLVVLCVCGIFPAISQQIITETAKQLLSPDGNYQFDIFQKQLSPKKKQLYYTVKYKGKSVLEESELGLDIDNELFESALGIPNESIEDWCDNLKFLSATDSLHNEVWHPVYGERSTVRDHYNELTMNFQKGVNNEGEDDGEYNKRSFYFFSIKVRAYNEGIAFCYHFPEATNGLFIHITGEQSQFSFPEGTLAYHTKWAQGPYQLLPLVDWRNEAERPLTLKLPNGLIVALAEANVVDYVRTKYKLDPQKKNTLKASMYDCADIITPYDTPWRVIMAAEYPTELIANNDIILNLNPACAIESTNWIKPGKVIRSGLSQKQAKACVDFAVEHNLQYVHLDAGWYGSEVKVASDATSVTTSKDIDLKSLCQYADYKGIGIWVYVNQRALVMQLDSILPRYKEWGIKGIKFGFVQIGNQRWTTWLHEAIKKCAEYEILVDIHDEYRPTGFCRTYPNLLTQEGIRGNEEMPDADHNTILPFTRFLAGAADYTICYYNNRIKNTHAHQLALAVVCYSPLQFLYWYDDPTLYNGEPEIEFFDNIKTVWDESIPINGEIGEYLIMARRSGKEWYVGAITNKQERIITLPTEFLEKGKKYEVKIYQDDDDVDSRTKVKVSTNIVKGGGILHFTLKASGGVALHISPVTK